MTLSPRTIARSIFRCAEDEVHVGIESFEDSAVSPPSFQLNHHVRIDPLVEERKRLNHRTTASPPPWRGRGPMIKPLSLLNQRINSNVMVELKGGRGYRGILEGFDPHMNLVLRAAEETQDSQSQRKMDLAIVRGDNVIYISP